MNSSEEPSESSGPLWLSHWVQWMSRLAKSYSWNSLAVGLSGGMFAFGQTYLDQRRAFFGL
ncbi:uncharacterized protein BDV17DRAFT_269843 [Aspergillus undulatus]|uniref:uncharacterized protein n=1 Tax=Aspergillus undulatus TaxID=1810928 RepID=UPI003CCCA129